MISGVASGGAVGSSCACGGLSDAEQQAVDALKSRDREVRDHEQAHARVGGEHAGTPSYSYQTGPDGKQYAVGGEVAIDASPEPDPEATVRKMEIVERAALAPAEPSAQDRKVAAEAQARRAQAQAELMAERSEKRASGDPEDASSAAEAGYDAAGAATANSAEPVSITV